jgi:hypothetical protein
MASQQKDIDGLKPEQPIAEAQAQGSLDSMHVERIRIRAYEVYLERGGEDGQDLDDWLQAERELTADQSDSAS